MVNYQDIEARNAIEAKLEVVSGRICKYPKLPSGLTTDEAKASPEWKADRAEFAALWKAMQNLNTKIVKDRKKN